MEDDDGVGADDNDDNDDNDDKTAQLGVHQVTIPDLDNDDNDDF